MSSQKQAQLMQIIFPPRLPLVSSYLRGGGQTLYKTKKKKNFTTLENQDSDNNMIYNKAVPLV